MVSTEKTKNHSTFGLHFILIVHFRHSTNYRLSNFVTTGQLILINLQLHVY